MIKSSSPLAVRNSRKTNVTYVALGCQAFCSLPRLGNTVKRIEAAPRRKFTYFDVKLLVFP